MKRKELIKYIDDNDLWIDVYVASTGNNDFGYSHVECNAILYNNSIKVIMHDKSEHILPIIIDRNEIDKNILNNYSQEHLLSMIFFDNNTNIVFDTTNEGAVNWIKLIVEDFVDRTDIKNVKQLDEIIKIGHERMSNKIQKGE